MPRGTSGGGLGKSFAELVSVVTIDIYIKFSFKAFWIRAEIFHDNLFP